jgi:ABC-type Fe3+ transport system permease subunit
MRVVRVVVVCCSVSVVKGSLGSGEGSYYASTGGVGPRWRRERPGRVVGVVRCIFVAVCALGPSLRVSM